MFRSSHRKLDRATPYAMIQIRKLTVDALREVIMATDYVLSDVITKAAYVCLAAAAFVFVAMLLLTGLHL
jgi:hypothetical protein